MLEGKSVLVVGVGSGLGKEIASVAHRPLLCASSQLSTAREAAKAAPVSAK